MGKATGWRRARGSSHPSSEKQRILACRVHLPLLHPPIPSTPGSAHPPVSFPQLLRHRQPAGRAAGKGPRGSLPLFHLQAGILLHLGHANRETPRPRKQRVRKRYREVRSLQQGHFMSQQQSQEENPSMTQKPCIFHQMNPHTHVCFL